MGSRRPGAAGRAMAAGPSAGSPRCLGFMPSRRCEVAPPWPASAALQRPGGGQAQPAFEHTGDEFYPSGVRLLCAAHPPDIPHPAPAPAPAGGVLVSLGPARALQQGQQQQGVRCGVCRGVRRGVQVQSHQGQPIPMSPARPRAARCPAQHPRHRPTCTPLPCERPGWGPGPAPPPVPGTAAGFGQVPAALADGISHAHTNEP